VPRLLWTQKEDIGPIARHATALAYDMARRHVVLFGGQNFVDNNVGAGEELRGDTWRWDGESWAQIADMGPRRRYMHALAYDRGRERIVLFGGVTWSAPDGGPEGSLGDTWEWDGVYWTQLADTGPAPRAGMAMVYDDARERVVLFGGGNDAGYFGDTWEWNGEEWAQREDIGPAPRTSHAMAYDARRRCVVLYGGTVATQQAPKVTSASDTWELSDDGWIQRSDMGPGRLEEHAMAHDARGTILFGGRRLGRSAVHAIAETWEWDGRLWIQRQDMGPAARYACAMAYDADRDRVVLFGGRSDKVAMNFGDTWELADALPVP